jgi:type 1 glutamine amidotransferase
MKLGAQFLCLLAIVVPCLVPLDARAGEAPKRVLFFYKSSDYQDDMVRPTNGQPGVAAQVLGDLGKANHLSFTFSADGSLFSADYLAQFDSICFFTSGDLTQRGYDNNPPMTSAGKAALLEAVRKGTGFIGIHSAADTFRSKDSVRDPYVEMLGGEFRTRIRLESSHLVAADRNFPGMAAVPEDFSPIDEWYVLENYSTNIHVLLWQDTASMVRGASYGPNFPSTWAQQYGQGRVFYTSMGHEAAVWHSPVFQSILTGALKWTVGDAPAEVKPDYLAPDATPSH